MCGGGVDLLPADITFTGVIVKESMGHRFYLNGDFKQLIEAKERMEKLDLNIVFEPIEIFIGEREDLRTRIKELNKKAGLPGVGMAFYTMAAA